LKTKRFYLIAALVLMVAAYYSWWIFSSGDNFRTHSTNALNRAAIVRLHGVLSIGAARSKVLDEYWSHRTPDLRLQVDARDRWVESMPAEFGATDWTLIVQFRDSVVSAVRVRTADGLRPAEGPPDKEGPDA
jgi:hypothetical protein